MSQFNTIPTLLRYHAESNDQREAFSGPGWEIVSNVTELKYCLF